MQRNFSIVRARQVVPGGTTSPGDGCLISCSADGWVRLNLTSGTYVDIFANAGTSRLDDMHVTGVGASSFTTPLATNVVVNVFDIQK